jgi:simple sugar transport system ATP-binding protein
MKAELGTIRILGTETTNSSPRTITELGVAHIPEDRQKDGLVLQIPVEDNLVLNTYYQEPFAKGIIMQPEMIHQNAETLIKDFDIRTPSPLVPVKGLSGGNQQKVIVAREFSRPIKLLIASQPTRGLDVGSIEYIHQRLIEKRDDGCAILLVSTELDEVMQLSDRIAVMYRGRIIAIVDADIVTKEELGLLMAGIETEIDTTKRKPTTVHEIVT